MDRSFEESTSPTSTINSHAGLRHELVTVDRRHVTPKSNHAHASICVVTFVANLCSRSCQSRCNHKCPRLICWMKAIALHIMFPIKFVKRCGTDLRYFFSNNSHTMLCILQADHEQALVKLVDFAFPGHRNILATTVAIHFGIGFQTSRAQRVQRNHWQQRVDARKSDS